MPHSHAMIWINAVFGTKDRKPLLVREVRQKVHRHIRDYLESLGCLVKIVNGTEDHVHILFRLNRNRSLSEVIKGVKGESSHWINRESLTSQRFAWQTGYGAFSVSASVVPKVESYIANQESHHRKKTFQEEYEQFLSQHGMEGNR